MIQQNQFDTIYHEHFPISFLAVEQVFARHGMKLFDVEELLTPGGCLRFYACHNGDTSKPIEAWGKEPKSWEETAGSVG